MTIQDQITEAQQRITFRTAESALAAIREIQASCEHYRRSLGQIVRWQLSRIKA
jgi:hypothetical protein